MALTDVKVRQTKPGEKPIKLADGNGLYLMITPAGSKLWRYKFRIAGKENVYAVGSYPSMSLLEARKARDEARDLVKRGINPTHHRHASVASNIASSANIFEAIALEWAEKKKDKWASAYYTQSISVLTKNVFPKIGKLPIRSITAHHILDILQTMESRGVATLALMARQQCSAIFRYAVMTLRADSDPAAALIGVVQRKEINHARPMSAEDIGQFKARLETYGGNRATIICMRLMLYLFVRTAEMRGAEWLEFDLVKGEWLIPKERMKRRREHWVPLPRQAIELLKELATMTSAGRYLFPSNKNPNATISPMTVNMAFLHMGYLPGEWTGHDFRATASTWLNEKGYRDDVIERQLAHVEDNKARRAYNHAEYADERKGMMQDWADWIDSIPAVLVTQHPER